MDKPRIFLGSSGKQEKLLQALTRGLSDIARVEPWTTSFNPGTSTLERLLELTQEVDFAAFVFAQDGRLLGPALGLYPPRTLEEPRRNLEGAASNAALAPPRRSWESLCSERGTLPPRALSH